jgi:hypothetical protein
MRQKASRAQGHKRGVRFRVWIARHLAEPNPTPAAEAAAAEAIAIEPAEPGTMSARHARCYVGAFNHAAMARRSSLRAVALPVVIRYEGEPAAGQRIRL